MDLRFTPEQEHFRAELRSWIDANLERTWTEETKFLNPFGFAGDVFGSSVAISGDVVVVGVPGEEILGMPHRLLVMHEGRINGELRRDEFSEEAVMRLATGLEKKELESLGQSPSSRQQAP